MKQKFLLIRKTALNFGGEWQTSTCTNRAYTFEPTLENYYKKLNCQTVEFAERKIGGVPFTFICDEEACCYNTPPVFSCKSKSDKRLNLCNSVLVCKTDKNGKTIGLTDAEVAYVKNFFNPLPDKNALMID